jgi:uncharacterized iron-regulated protein
MRRRDFLVAASALLLPLPARAMAGTVWDLRAGRAVDEATLFDALREARYRLLGEVHDNARHHAIRAQLIDSLGRAGLKPVVAFEQFDAEHDPALQALVDPDAEDVAKAVRFDRRGWDWELYRPIVEAALAHRMPLRAANLSRGMAMRIARGEFPATLPPWPPERERRLRRYIFQGHCEALPERALPGMAMAQRFRDSMLAGALKTPPRDGAVLIAGNAHVRQDFGVPLHLPAGALSVGFLEAGPGDLADQGPLPYDFAWFTEPAERPDPCAAFRKK